MYPVIIKHMTLISFLLVSCAVFRESYGQRDDEGSANYGTSAGTPVDRYLFRYVQFLGRTRMAQEFCVEGKCRDFRK